MGGRRRSFVRRQRALPLLVEPTADSAARLSYAERLAESLWGKHSQAFFIGGSSATGSATLYSDIDIVHVVSEGYTGPLRKFYYDGGLLAAVTARTLTDWRDAATQPERAIFVVPAIQSAIVLIDPQGVVADYKAELASFIWEPLQEKANHFAGALVASQAETVHKVLSGLVRSDNAYDATAILALDMTLAIAVFRGVLVESSATYMPRVRQSMGETSAWSQWHLIATSQRQQPTSLREQAIAAVNLYHETFQVLRTHMAPDRRDLALATNAVVQSALRMLS